jgi:hypothetical protein
MKYSRDQVWFEVKASNCILLFTSDLMRRLDMVDESIMTRNLVFKNDDKKETKFYGKMARLVVDKLSFKLKEMPIVIIDLKGMHELKLSTENVIEITAGRGKQYSI